MLEKKENRTHYKRIRLTQKESIIIEEKAKDSGLTISEYIRRAAIGKTIKKRRNLDSDKILYQLAKIGGNLNQLAKNANSGNYNKSEIDLATQELLNILQDMK